MFRKRKPSAPHFKVPTPFNPITGQYADLRGNPELTHCAMMQVIEADTHDNYVVCRGYDPEHRVFLDSVPVAKPYGDRGSNSYEVGQVFAAVRPITRLGQTSGVSETTVGHPADLDELVEILKDADDNPIAWLILGGGGGGGGSDLIFSRATGTIDAATGWGIDDAGSGTVHLVELDVSQTVINRFFDAYVELTPLWVAVVDGDYQVIAPGCAKGPEVA